MKQLPRRSYLFIICALWIATGMVACQKTDSHQLGAPVDGDGGGGIVGGTATFSLASPVSNATVYGTFEQGIPLGSSSTITVTVDVTQPGTWVYTTGQVNGFQFGGSGDFITTGKKSIRLYAVGTPNKPGSFNFKMKIGTGNCLVAVKVAKPGESSGVGEYYYKATIDGTNYFQDVTDHSGFIASTGGGGNAEYIFTGMINFNGALPAGKTAFGIYKGLFKNYHNLTRDKFYEFFAPGDYPYTTDYKAVNGVQVCWTDPAGVYWSTAYGTGNQAGSTFTIVSTEDANDLFGRLFLQSKVRFTCKLYNGAGAVKTLTNGEALVKFAAR